MPEVEVTQAALTAFVQAVELEAQRAGWPVNGYMIGPEIFPSDHTTTFNTIRAVLKECEKQGLLVVTTGGEIHGIAGTQTQPIVAVKRVALDGHR